MSFLKGSPTTRCMARAFAFATNSSYTLSCTYVREPAQQHCPCKLNNIDLIIHSAGNVYVLASMNLIDLTCKRLSNLIEEEGKMSKFNCLVYISILAYNERRFSSKLQSHWLQITLGCHFKHQFSNLG